MIEMRRIKHCPKCGAPVAYRMPDDDNRERAVCPACTNIHYENPLNVVGTVPVWGEQVLLCKRAIEPRYGFWTLPAGFMELGETVADGALRETVEEAGARVDMHGLFTLLNVVRAGQVHLAVHRKTTSRCGHVVHENSPPQAQLRYAGQYHKLFP